MSMLRKPMTACPVDYDKLRYPVVAMPKIDGIRCVVYDGVGYGRSLKPLPNRHLQTLMKDPVFEQLDMEVVVGSPVDPNCMQNTMRGVMSHEGEYDIQLMIFDRVMEGRYHERLRYVRCLMEQLPSYARVLEPMVCMNRDTIEKLHHTYVTGGYEGLILRDPNSLYKHGRGTMTDQCLMKLKAFGDGEAVVIGYEPLYLNHNPAFKNALGRTERSSSMTGLEATDQLGAFVVRDLKTQVTFRIGTGMTQQQRKTYWQQRDSLIGRIIHYRSFEDQGVVVAPRHPVFHGFRDSLDME